MFHVHHCHMGKTEQLAEQTALRDENEIHLLADEGVENIDDFRGVEQKTEVISYGNSDDDRAINRIKSRLATSPDGRTEDQIEDLAIALYNRTCEGIRDGSLSSAQIAKAAEIFGETPDIIRQRFRDS